MIEAITVAATKFDWDALRVICLMAGAFLLGMRRGKHGPS